MNIELLPEKYAKQIKGIQSSFDRIIIQGTLPQICYSEGMSRYLSMNGIRIFDYEEFAKPLKDQIRDNAEKIATENNLEIDFIAKQHIRKESVIAEKIEKRGSHPGLVGILSAMEGCPYYKPWHDKRTGKTYLKGGTAKCLHYYFYFIDEELGLSYVRVPTWSPFRLQFFFNGHQWLSNELKKAGIAHKLLDNAFVDIADFKQAQEISDHQLKVATLHQKLDRIAAKYCPVTQTLGIQYRWSIMQIEYATDIIFKRQKDLAAIYENLTRTAIHTVKPEKIATFLGRKLDVRYEDEMGNDFSTRIEGTRIKHVMGKVSIKMYDKFGLVLRIETTSNDISFFKHYREVEKRDGTKENKITSMKKSIYSLPPLQEIMRAANRRYLEFISSIDDISCGLKKLSKVTGKIESNNRNYKGFNFFDYKDQRLFEILASGEFNISGFQNKDIRRKVGESSSAKISRILKSLRLHGLVKRVGKTYKYYLSRLGRQVIATGLKLTCE